MTAGAREFIGPATLAALSGRPVAEHVFACPEHPLGAHIDLAERAELLCVAPATANVLAKAATGLADDLLSTLLFSFTGPVLLAPAMNSEMWEKPAVQRNVQRLRDDGVHFVGPDEGWLSCRQQGPGRMSEPEKSLPPSPPCFALAGRRGDELPKPRLSHWADVWIAWLISSDPSNKRCSPWPAS